MSKPFRERNPVIIGAISLAVIAVMILGAFRAQDLPVIGGGDTYTAAFSEAGGLKTNDPVRIAGVRVGSVESIELEGDHVKVSFRVKTDSDVRHRDRRLDPGQHPARRDVPRAGAGRLRPARHRQGDPGRADQLALRRRQGVLRPRRDRRPDRHRPAGPVADHPLRPDPQHSRGVQGGAVRRLAALLQHRRQERPDPPAAHQPAAGLHGAQRARRRHRRPDEGVRHPLPGAGRPARGGAQPAGVDLDPVDRAERPGPRRAGRTSSRP